MTTLTYLQFHLLFLGLPLLALATATARGVALWTDVRPPTHRVPVAGRPVDARVIGIVIMGLLALVYTTPWDSYLIRRGAWSYGEGAVLVRYLQVPLGEYLFFVAQTVLTALWLYLLPAGLVGGGLSARADGGATVGHARSRRRVTVGQRALGAGGAGLVALAGWWALDLDGGLYLGTLLLWAAPVLAIQWAFDWPYLWARRRVVAAGVAVPTVYLWAADRVALALGVWELSPTLTTGFVVPLLGLPVEEAAFFLLTNLFLVQGLVLWLRVADRWL